MEKSIFDPSYSRVLPYRLQPATNQQPPTKYLSVLKTFISFLAFTVPLLLWGQSQGDDIVGVWLNEKKEAVVKIYKEGQEYHGKIIDIRGEHADKKATLKDVNNPQPELRVRPLIDMPLLENLTFKDGEYQGGTAYNPRMGRYFDCKAWLISGNIMKIRGYWGFLFATETWEKIE